MRSIARRLVGVGLALVFIPVCASAQELPRAEQTVRSSHEGESDRVFTAALTGMVVVQALDTISTLKAVSRPDVREANPMMAPLVKRPVLFVASKAGLTLATVHMTRGLHRRNPKAAKILTFVIDSAFSAIVISNFRLLQRH
jgi:hypothetical protein